MKTFIVYIQGAYGKTKTIINIEDNKKMSDLANAICNSKLNHLVNELNCSSHLYRFTENLKNAFHSSEDKWKSYDKQGDIFEGLQFVGNTRSAYKTNIEEVFASKGKTLLFAYDFGTTTYFMVRSVN